VLFSLRPRCCRGFLVGHDFPFHSVNDGIMVAQIDGVVKMRCLLSLFSLTTLA
jgi:hypothetical protein